MKTRLEEVESEILKNDDVLIQFARVCELEHGMSLSDFMIALNKKVKLEIEKHDILKNIS